MNRVTTGDGELLLTPHPLPNRNKHLPPRNDVSEYSFGGSCVRLWELHVEVAIVLGCEAGLESAHLTSGKANHWLLEPGRCRR